MIPDQRKQQLLAKAQACYQHVAEARDYLESRGVTGRMAQRFLLGYVTPDIDPTYAGRLSIPYLTPAGVVGIKYRDLSGLSGAKYMSEPGCGTHLFNAPALLEAGPVAVLTEGEFDAVAVTAATGLPAVGYPGTNTWAAQRHWPACFDHVSEVVVVADGDKPGREAAHKVAGSMSQARVVDLPDGLDANSFLLAEGADALADLIRGA